jgi:hypothetical protein
MRLVKAFGVAFVVVFAIGMMASSGASAHEFEFTSVPALLLAAADGPQLFSTLAAHLECTTQTGDGRVTELKNFHFLTVAVKYTGCKATAHGLTAKPDEPIVAEYEYSAEGVVTILKDISILASFVGVKCVILVLAQGPLSSVKYDNINSNTELLLLSHVREILNSASGAGCAETYTNSKAGLFIGNSFLKVESGSIDWK